MNETERRLLIAAEQCNIPAYKELFAEGAKEIRLHLDASEKLEAIAHKPPHEREPPHCPTCECGMGGISKADVEGCIAGIQFDGPDHEDGSTAGGGAES